MKIQYNNSPSGLPVTLTGFESINRYWDEKHDIYAAKILPGEFYVSVSGELITTVLGSCISACIRDRKTGIGGMNHFMLPTDIRRNPNSWNDTPVNMQTRYGNIAMERLINVILASGGKRSNLEIKLFGGGKVLQIDTDIGGKNISFVKQYLMTEGLKVAAEDVGGIYPRKVLYFPKSGRVRVKKLINEHNDTVKQREKKYIKSLDTSPIEGRIDLF
ncbi:MAG: chemoreceptor glutamine deamidase CheD [Gammaproteobacteria bacterium]|nr:chemoreceptor glutamine deamidase CheD [Gammaproteobacteria bacterium]MBT8134743.1 chemoreceptor glutamine deamidase CheD [Gammaproteobacteria bacterium]NNJ49665.1 chemoreceptor glutamine deamidase CheD [Gammaproteobacteria bacterium]